MPKDWKDISDDEVLNFSGPQTAETARYERIMQKRSIDAIVGLWWSNKNRQPDRLLNRNGTNREQPEIQKSI